MLAGFIRISDGDVNYPNLRVGEILPCELHKEKSSAKNVEILIDNVRVQLYDISFTDEQIREELLVQANLLRHNYSKVVVEIIKE